MPSQQVKSIHRQLKQLANPAIAEHSQRFFKTGPGEYAEGDQFIGIRVPVLRKLAKQHRELELADVEELLQSPIHEARLLSLLILVLQFDRSDKQGRKSIYDLYLRNLQQVNNWDLVDSSAHYIVGGYLRDRSRKPLYRLAKSRVLWERRVAIIATLAYIKEGDLEDTLTISEILLNDEEDLIHKATGWMLREAAKQNSKPVETFLKKHLSEMPRTMLRYAIERFPETLRKQYLTGNVR